MRLIGLGLMCLIVALPMAFISPIIVDSVAESAYNNPNLTDEERANIVSLCGTAGNLGVIMSIVGFGILLAGAFPYSDDDTSSYSNQSDTHNDNVEVAAESLQLSISQLESVDGDDPSEADDKVDERLSFPVSRFTQVARNINAVEEEA